MLYILGVAVAAAVDVIDVVAALLCIVVLLFY